MILACLRSRSHDLRQWRPRGLPLTSMTRWLLFLVVCWGASIAGAQSARPAASDVQIGIDGQYRVGQWTGVRIDADRSADRALRLETIDGDGVEVAYVDAHSAPSPDPADDARREASESSPPHSSPWRYVIPGLPSAPLTIRTAGSNADEDAELLRRLRFPDQSIAADRQWLLVIGDPLGLDEIGRNELLRREAWATTTIIEDPQTLPDHWLGFEGINSLLITGTATDLLQQFDEARTDALLHWVRRGGQVLITLGETGPAAVQQSRLVRELIGWREDPTAVRFEPTALEAFTSSRSPLEPFWGTLLPTEQGQPLLIGRTLQRQPAPLAMRYRYGFGQVVAIAAELENETFGAWPQRTDLLDAFAPEVVPQQRERIQSSRSGEIAYTDIAGQLRATLDRFPSSGSVPFSLAALILMVLFLLVGPLDYFLINRWLGRPLLGWITFPLMICLLSGALIAWAYQADKSLAVNRVEVIDVDPRTGWGQVFSWAHVFSPTAGRWNVESRLDAAMTQSDDNSLLLAPFGYASSTFGGVQVTDRRLPGYEVLVSRVKEMAHSQLQEVPLAPASSKGLAGWTQFETSLQAPEGLVSFRGTELLGALTNPLPFDLLDGFLLYDDWIYLLPTRFPASSTIESVESLRQKTFRWHLTRRKALESSTETEDWDPRRDDDLARLVEILSFYGVAGGDDYTKLTNDPLERLDLSTALDNQQAILVGRLEKPAVTLDLQKAGSPAFNEPGARHDRTVTVIRVMLPVAADDTQR